MKRCAMTLVDEISIVVKQLIFIEHAGTGPSLFHVFSHLILMVTQ